MWPTAAFRDICCSTIYPFEGAPHPTGCRQGVPSTEMDQLHPVHCNYGSIWLRFRDMTRDRQTDRRTDDRQTSAPFHDMATRSGPHNNKDDSFGKYYSSPVPPSCTAFNNIPCTFILYRLILIHLSLSNWAIQHTVINNKLADRYFHVGYLS